jgi:maltooligosyltrehalose trehalohydrolase
MPPMMFMGEEWGSLRPFPFFCDFSGALADAVRSGRKREFAAAYRHEDRDGEVPDPLAEATFRSAMLDWDAIGEPRHAARLDLVKRLLRARRLHVVPLLAGFERPQSSARFRGARLNASWAFERGTLALTANLSNEDIDRGDEMAGALFWGGEAPPRLPAWSVFWAADKK